MFGTLCCQLSPCNAEIRDRERSAGYIICSNCRRNGKFANQVKSEYNLIDKSVHQALLKEKENLIKETKEAQETLIKEKEALVKEKQILLTFITEKLVDCMHQYSGFMDNIKKHQSCLKGYITKSIRRITKAVEKAVLGIISDQAKTLSSNIQTQNKDNQQRIKSSEKSRDEINKRLINEKIETSHIDFDEEMKDENPEITEHIYQKEEVEQFVKLLNANVEKYKLNATVLFRLKAEGEKIVGELSREDKDLDTTLNTTIDSEKETLKLSTKE